MNKQMKILFMLTTTTRITPSTRLHEWLKTERNTHDFETKKHKAMENISYSEEIQ